MPRNIFIEKKQIERAEHFHEHLAAQRGLLPYGGSAWCPYRERGFETSDEVGVGAPSGEAVPLAERLELSPLHPREIHPRARTSSPAGDHHGLAISSSPAAPVRIPVSPVRIGGRRDTRRTAPPVSYCCWAGRRSRCRFLGN